MRRHLILHIGLPKTGTSAIQHFLVTRRKALLRQGFCYPSTPGGSNHVALAAAAALHGKPRKWQDEVKQKAMGVPPRLEDFWQQFHDEITALPPQIGTVILSAERFSSQLDSQDKIENLRAALEPLFADMRVIVYLRRQDTHATSAYSQMLRFGIIEPPALDQPLSRYRGFYDYESFLARWTAVFGRDAMTPRLFERAAMAEGDAVADFTRFCGIGKIKLAAPEAAVRNQSIDIHGQALLIAVGRLMQQQSGSAKVAGRIWDELTDIVSDTCAGQGWRPSRAEARAFMAQYADSNEAVRKDWFPERATLFDLKDSDLPEHPITLDPQPLALVGAVVLEALRRGVQADSEVRLNKALAALALGQKDKAGVLLQKAVRLDGGNVNARIALARHMADAGQTAGAVEQAEAALSAKPGSRAARKLLEELGADI
jgi:tetratricopeptide (TPR) repeat protein